jgi:hypothetical protein
LNLKKIKILAFLLLTCGCATNFTGSAHISKKDCTEKCSSWGMTLVGMVAMGDYSDACVCKNAGTNAQSDTNGEFLMSSAATSAGAAGVLMQRRKAEAATGAGMVH